MDHAYVEEHDLVESYLADRLSAEDRDAFEAHYFACETCIEHLETATAFREGMRQAAAEDVAQAAAAHVRLGLLAALAAGLSTLSRRHRLALAGILLLLAALPSLWLVQRNRTLQQRLAAASAGAAQAATAEQQRAALEARLHSLEQAAAADRCRLAEEGRAREAALQTPQPQINVPLFLLAAVRSGEPGREPASQIPLSSAAGSVILTAELATVDYPAYRASLHTAGGKEIWQAQGLHPDSRDTLVLLLPASMLQPGVYHLKVEGANNNGESFAVAAYPFRVVRRP